MPCSCPSSDYREALGPPKLITTHLQLLSSSIGAVPDQITSQRCVHTSLSLLHQTLISHPLPPLSSQFKGTGRAHF